MGRGRLGHLTPNTQVFFAHYLRAFAVAGLPYFVLAEKRRYCPENCLSDPYLKLRVLLKDLWLRRFRQAGRRLATPRFRRTYLMAIVRIHYIPIMVEQIHFGVTRTTAFAQTANIEWTLMTVVGAVTALCWLVDSNNGAMGCFWESWFTKTRYKEMDPYPLHWFVVLIGYIPFFYYAHCRPSRPC